MDSSLHRTLSVHAAASGQSFNDLVCRILRRALSDPRGNASAKKGKMSALRRQTKGQQIRLTLYADLDTKKRFSARVKSDGRSASLIVQEIANAWLAERPARQSELVSALIKAKKAPVRL
jgi:hypothetical protein